jgi:hypothetical protein
MRRSWAAQSGWQGRFRTLICARHRAVVAVMVIASLTLARAGGVGGANSVVGHIWTTSGSVTMARGVPVTKEADLHAQDLVRIGPTGGARIELKLKKTTCTAGRNTQLRVLPAADIAFQMLGTDGDLTCGTGSNTRQPIRGEGPTGSFVISLVDPVFRISMRGRWTTVKVDRGALVVTGRTKLKGVVLAKKQQSVVPRGGDPRIPERITLPARERVVFAALERTIPAPTDTTAPKVTILAKPETKTPIDAATFSFRASEPGVTFSCSLDGPDFRVCSSPAAFSLLAAGRHTFAVRATDAAGNAGSPVAYSWRITGGFRQVIARDATDIGLAVDARGRALVTFRAGGRAQSVLAWGAINARPSIEGGDQEKFKLVYGAPAIDNVCSPYDGPALAWLVTACKAPDGTYWALQQWQRGLPTYGVPPTTAVEASYELHLSHWSGPLAVLEIETDWSYHRYDHLYGRLTYRGRPVFGFGSTAAGDPRDIFGRNVYLDTYDSVYGPGWRREMGLLTHRPTGAFCYGFSAHPPHPPGNGTRYRATVVGPGVTPDLMWEGEAPGPYDPVRDAAANAQQRQLLAGDKSCKIT